MHTVPCFPFIQIYDGPNSALHVYCQGKCAMVKRFCSEVCMRVQTVTLESFLVDSFRDKYILVCFNWEILLFQHLAREYDCLFSIHTIIREGSNTGRTSEIQ